MTQELIYTSAPRGLKPGARGFCTVACTQGMSKPLAEQLEALSGYRPIYPTGDERAGDNPVNFSHSILRISGNEYHVLSRVADAGFDYTQRSNKLAHHVVLGERELTACGPAAMLAAPGFMVQSWSGEPQLISAGRPAREVAVPAGQCAAWERATGDAGWGGVLAETALTAGTEPVVVIYRAGFDPLPLVNEALSLLTMSTRWKTTFSTYYTKGSGIDCRWRFMVEGTAEAKLARRTPNARLIDLCVPQQPAEGGELVQAARTGARPAPPSNEDSARRRQEKLLQFGTAAQAPASASVPPADEAAYGIALPEVPPLGQPSVQANAKQREAAKTRRRRRVTLGVIAVVSLLVVGGMGAAAYVLTREAEKVAQQLSVQEDGNTKPQASGESKDTHFGDNDDAHSSASAKVGDAKSDPTQTNDDDEKSKNKDIAVQSGSDEATTVNGGDESTAVVSSDSNAPTTPPPAGNAPNEATDTTKRVRNEFLASMNPMQRGFEIPPAKNDNTKQIATLAESIANDVTLDFIGISDALAYSGNAESFRIEKLPNGFSIKRIQNDWELARFSIESRELRFAWSDNVESWMDRKPIQHLQNGILLAEFDGEQQRIPLRIATNDEDRTLSRLFHSTDPTLLTIDDPKLSERQFGSLRLLSVANPNSSVVPSRKGYEKRLKATSQEIDRSVASIAIASKVASAEPFVDLEFLLHFPPRKPNESRKKNHSTELHLQVGAYGPVWKKPTADRTVDSHVASYSLELIKSKKTIANEWLKSFEKALAEEAARGSSASTADQVKNLEWQKKTTEQIVSFYEKVEATIGQMQSQSWSRGKLCVKVQAATGDYFIDIATLGDSELPFAIEAISKEAQH